MKKIIVFVLTFLLLIVVVETGITKQKPESQTQNESKIVVGAIVPHHDLADKLIVEVFQAIKQNRDPKTIILIGPNHYELGDTDAIIDSDTLNTDLGKQLVREGYASLNDAVMSQEHSVKVLLPYVQEYFPKAEVVSIILSSKHSIPESAELARVLAREEALIISSVDFSHYLNIEQANINDEITYDAIVRKDYGQLSEMNSDYLDSPPSIITLLSAMEEFSIDDQTKLNHSNSAIILNADIESTTSYFTLLFFKQ